MTSTPIVFGELGLSDDLLSAVESAGFTSPTAVQAEGIPAFLQGTDILIQAQTGTGKTAAFVLPILEGLQRNPGTIEVLVLTPTRELARQVCEEFKHFGAPRGIEATPIYGGTSFEKQFDALETAQVVVATPGRLLDLLRRKRFDPRGIRYFGLDEADELLSMGFEKDVLDVIAQIPKKRQSFLCSATINAAVHRVAQNFITDPVVVDVSSDEIGAKSVRHEHFKIRPADKLEALRRLVQTDARGGAIVFANTRAATFLVNDALAREGVSADVLNGDLSQAEREKALHRMKDDQVQFLVATDVAARGIDISGLPAVVNYDMPESPDVYIHRTGRTGRAGQAGVAYSLVAPSDVSVFHQLEKFYKLEFHERSLPSREKLREVVADEAISEVLEGLDAGADLEYAGHMPLARRLAERADGARLVAKLIAHWEGTSGRVVVPKAKAAPAPVAESAPDIENTEESNRRPGRGRRGEEETKEKSRHVREEAESAAESQAAAATPDEDEEAPKSETRRRTRRRGSEPAAEAAAETKEAAAETKEAAPSEKPARSEKPAAPTLGGSAEADAIEKALAGASRQRGRWRGTRSLAKELDASEDEIVAVLESDAERFEQSRKKPGHWRLMKSPRSASGSGDQSRDASRSEGRPAAPPKAERKESKPERKEPKARAPKKEQPKSEPKARSSRGGSSKSSPAPAPASSGGSYVTLTVNVGSSHGIDAATLTEELILLAGLDDEDVGRVLIEEEISKVDVVEDYWEDMLNAIQGQTVAGETLDVQRPRRRGKKR